MKKIIIKDKKGLNFPTIKGKIRIIIIILNEKKAKLYRKSNK